MASKKLDFDAPILSVRPALSPAWRLRPVARDSHGLVPFAWEEAPGRSKYVLSNDTSDDNDNDDDGEDEFSDALTELSHHESNGERKHEVKQSSDDDDDGDQGVLKGCGLMGSFWLTATPVLVNRAISRMKTVLGKQKKHVASGLVSCYEAQRTWESKKQEENPCPTRSRCHQPISHPHPRSPSPSRHRRGEAQDQPPLSRGRPILDHPRRVFFDPGARYSSGAAYAYGVLPMRGIDSRSWGRMAGGGHRMDPMYYAKGAIHHHSGYTDGDGPPALVSPAKPWVWTTGRNRFHRSKIWKPS